LYYFCATGARGGAPTRSYTFGIWKEQPFGVADLCGRHGDRASHAPVIGERIERRKPAIVPDPEYPCGTDLGECPVMRPHKSGLQVKGWCRKQDSNL
jgi:hypothetical protein